MKTSAQSASNQSRAFTLTELLVVIGTVAILAALALPALASINIKSGRMQCANNLRQIGIATMIYAGEYNTWLPPWGGKPSNSRTQNGISSMTYARYVVFASSPSTKAPTNCTTYDENMGYLYGTGLAGNGQIFYCPDQWGSALGASAYLPLLTTDSINGGGAVRSSYIFNPRINTSNSQRRFQRTSQIEPRKLLAVDYVDSNIVPTLFAHTRERGWNVLFTDGGVSFSRNDQAYNLVAAGRPSSPIDAEQNLWDLMELDH
jgi:type II secretory pathway pseudopilin PulG